LSSIPEPLKQDKLDPFRSLSLCSSSHSTEYSKREEWAISKFRTLMKKQSFASLVCRRSRSTLCSSLVPWTMLVNFGDVMIEAAHDASTRPPFV